MHASARLSGSSQWSDSGVFPSSHWFGQGFGRESVLSGQWSKQQSGQGSVQIRQWWPNLFCLINTNFWVWTIRKINISTSPKYSGKDFYENL